MKFLFSFDIKFFGLCWLISNGKYNHNFYLFQITFTYLPKFLKTRSLFEIRITSDWFYIDFLFLRFSKIRKNGNLI